MSRPIPKKLKPHVQTVIEIEGERYEVQYAYRDPEDLRQRYKTAILFRNGIEYSRGSGRSLAAALSVAKDLLLK